MYIIKKGLDLPISGNPSPEIEDSSKISSVAILGSDFVGLKPTMLVKVGDYVQAGQKIIEDKKLEKQTFQTQLSEEKLILNSNDNIVESSDQNLKIKI